MLRGQLVLVDDDERDIGLPLTSIIRPKAGDDFRVGGADYRGAVMRLERQPTPCIVILDFDYNNDRTRTGVHLALWMREQPHLANTKRVLYSSMNRAVIEATLREQIAANPALEGVTLDTLFTRVVPKDSSHEPLVLIEMLKLNGTSNAS
jgi:hypothetical protein